MPRYNFLDEAGLKKYHQLTGYSTIPMTAITNYTSGELNFGSGAVISSTSYRVTDHITLSSDKKYTILNPSASRSVICYYESDNTFVFGEEFGDKISFTLKDKAKNGKTPSNIRVSFKGQVLIQSLHQNTITWLCNDILENRGDIATNSTEINNVKNMVYKAHCTHNIKLSKTIVEIGTSTSVYAARLNFLFNNKNQSAADGVTSAKVYKTGGGVITGINNSNINTDVTNGSTTLLGNPNSTVTVNPGYEIVYNGNTFTGSYTITAVHPIYYGGGGVGTISGGSGVSITKDNLRSRFGSSTLKTSASGTYTITLSSKNYIFVVSPYEISTDKIFNASTGFKFPMDPLGTLTVTNIGAGAANATYYVYRSNELDPGTYNIQIK